MTYEALTNDDRETLAKFIKSYLVKDMLNSSFTYYDSLQNKKELKFILKAHIYLDTLITFYRWG